MSSLVCRSFLQTSVANHLDVCLQITCLSTFTHVFVPLWRKSLVKRISLIMLCCCFPFFLLLQVVLLLINIVNPFPWKNINKQKHWHIHSRIYILTYTCTYSCILCEVAFIKTTLKRVNRSFLSHLLFLCKSEIDRKSLNYWCMDVKLKKLHKYCWTRLKILRGVFENGLHCIPCYKNVDSERGMCFKADFTFKPHSTKIGLLNLILYSTPKRRYLKFVLSFVTHRNTLDPTYIYS